MSKPRPTQSRRRPRRLFACLLVLLAFSVLTVGLGYLLQSYNVFHEVKAVLGGDSASTPTPVATPVSSNVIIAENRRLGTTKWMTKFGGFISNEIQAYAGATSVAPGDQLSFYVSVEDAGTPYHVDVYRLGWYSGTGAREVYGASKIGVSQGYYDETQKKLIDCRTCYMDPTTRRVEARWKPSLTITVPSDWITGVYLAEFTLDDGAVSYLQFDVRGDFTSAYVVSTADAAYEAYNQWGGYSLYEGPRAILPGPDGSHASRAYAVSFDRPLDSSGMGQGLPYEIDAIRWFERNGYDVSYVSSVDLDEHPELLLSHRAYIDLGHDEYWSKRMYDGVEAARDAGRGLAFLGADEIYWQVRFAPDGLGAADRTIICYKDATLDPMSQTDPTLVTVRFRDSPVNRPENSLIGIMYSSPNYAGGGGFPWVLSASASLSSPLLARTGLTPRSTYGCDYVGYEWDRVFDNGATPAGLQILGASEAIDHTGVVDVSDTTYYIAASGAFVFAAGSVHFQYALDGYRMLDYGHCRAGSVANVHIQAMMAHVLAYLPDHRAHLLPLA